MINFFAFRYFVFYLLSYTAPPQGHQNHPYSRITSSIYFPSDATSRKIMHVFVPYTHIPVAVVGNGTHTYGQVRFPRSLPFCPSFQTLAPRMPCEDDSVVDLESFNKHLDLSLLHKWFSIKFDIDNFNSLMYFWCQTHSRSLFYRDRFPHGCQT